MKGMRERKDKQESEKGKTERKETRAREKEVDKDIKRKEGEK